METVDSGSSDLSTTPSYANLLRLDGKRFIVAGAGEGIGRQTSSALTEMGAEIVCLDRDATQAARVASDLGATSMSGDLSRREDVERIVAEVGANLGRLDGFVDIVGRSQASPILDITDELWDAQLDQNLRHAMLLAQTVGRRLSDQGSGGSMVFISSAMGIDSAPSHAVYGAAKAALVSFVRTAAIEFAPLGVRVNAVSPGPILTPFVRSVLDDDTLQHLADNAPLGRMGIPADIAGAVLFLMSPLAGYITGQTLVVDGGVDVKFRSPLPGL